MNKIELPNIRVLDEDELWSRHHSGLILPPTDELPVLGDCGDDRGITLESFKDRRTQFEYNDLMYVGRNFGSVVGVVANSLINVAAAQPAMFRDLYRQHAEGLILDFSFDLTERAKEQNLTRLHFHSDEFNDVMASGQIPEGQLGSPLGCAFKKLFGQIMHTAAREDVRQRAVLLAEKAQEELPVQTAWEGIKVVSELIQPEFGIDRETLRNRMNSQTPFVVKAGKHADPYEAKLVLDMDGWRSSTMLHNDKKMPRYWQTPSMSERIAPKLLPEFSLDPTVLRASSLIIGEAVRLNLSPLNDPNAIAIELIRRGSGQEFGIAA